MDRSTRASLQPHCGPILRLHTHCQKPPIECWLRPKGKPIWMQKRNQFLVDAIGSTADDPKLDIDKVRSLAVTMARNLKIPAPMLNNWLDTLPKSKDGLRDKLIQFRNVATGSANLSTPTPTGFTPEGAPITASRGGFNYAATGTGVQSGLAPGEFGLLESFAGDVPLHCRRPLRLRRSIGRTLQTSNQCRRCSISAGRPSNTRRLSPRLPSALACLRRLRLTSSRVRKSLTSSRTRLPSIRARHLAARMRRGCSALAQLAAPACHGSAVRASCRSLKAIRTVSTKPVSNGWRLVRVARRHHGTMVYAFIRQELRRSRVPVQQIGPGEQAKVSPHVGAVRGSGIRAKLQERRCHGWVEPLTKDSR